LPAALGALRGEWAALWERVPSATPFQSPEWLLPWLGHLWGGGEIFSFAFRAGDRLVGLAPVFLFGPGGRQAALIGAGVSDYLGVLFEPEFAEVCAVSLAARLTGDERGIGIEFTDLPEGSALLSLENGSREHCAVCPALALPGSMEPVLAALDPKFRTDVRRAGNRIRAAGGYRFETACPEQAPEYLEALFRLHARCWSARGEAGVLGAPPVQAFHREAVGPLARKGIARMFALRREDEFVAVIYALARGSIVYAYLSGFDPDASRLSPGAVLLAYAIEQSIQEGFREFDFLRGGERYKYDWGARDRFTWRLRLPA
jgi:CelD/BcsL family acetyltransferase involved in cellulose biosynthesis